MALALVAASPAQAAPPGGDDAPADTQVCHLRGNAGYFSLWLTEDGAADHIADDPGDGEPGDEVPGMDGYEFDADCQPELAGAATCTVTDETGRIGTYAIPEGGFQEDGTQYVPLSSETGGLSEVDHLEFDSFPGNEWYQWASFPGGNYRPVAATTCEIEITFFPEG